jgi:hypothetical protein
MSEPMLTIFLKPETVSEASHAVVNYRDGVALRHNIRVSPAEDSLRVEIEKSSLDPRLAVNLNLLSKENKPVYWTAI